MRRERRGIRIRWADGHEAWFHNRWLRENCSCALCTHPDAWERTLDLLAVPLDLTPDRVLTDAAGLRVEWPAHVAPCNEPASLGHGSTTTGPSARRDWRGRPDAPVGAVGI